MITFNTYKGDKEITIKAEDSESLITFISYHKDEIPYAAWIEFKRIHHIKATEIDNE